MKQIEIHLISDCDIHLLTVASKAMLERFKDAKTTERIWGSVNTIAKLADIKKKMLKAKIFVIYTIKNDAIRDDLKNFCRQQGIPCAAILSEIIREFSSYIGQKPDSNEDQQSEIFTDDYFTRINAINYALSHDDGQNMWNLEDADIVIVGVSRTSKSPTSIYLAYQGYKVANVPFVVGSLMPDNFKNLNSLIVGLTIDPQRLLEIRKNRLALNQDHNNKSYSQEEKIKDEINQVKKIFLKNNWTTIDVTNRSVEETAAIIARKYRKKFAFDKLL